MGNNQPHTHMYTDEIRRTVAVLLSVFALGAALVARLTPGTDPQFASGDGTSPRRRAAATTTSNTHGDTV